MPVLQNSALEYTNGKVREDDMVMSIYLEKTQLPKIKYRMLLRRWSSYKEREN